MHVWQIASAWQGAIGATKRRAVRVGTDDRRVAAINRLDPLG